MDLGAIRGVPRALLIPWRNGCRLLPQHRGSMRGGGTMLEKMRDSAFIAARPDATLDIARDLANMLYKQREELKKGNKAPVGVAVAA